MGVTPTVAALSQGALFICGSDGKLAPIRSYFAEQLMENQARERQRAGWRQQSGLWGGLSPDAPMNPGLQLPDIHQRPVTFASLGRGRTGVLYVLRTTHIAGLFAHSFADDDERRLVHRQAFEARDPVQNGDGDIVLSSVLNDGSANLALCDHDGRRLREITEGDAIDECPSWVEGQARRIVFQSAGIGRNAHGLMIGLSPYRIEMIDLDSEAVTTLAEDDAHDLLQPRLTADGSLWFIRRPYRATLREPYGPLAFLKDAALFPFRLGRAIFYFLNFFSAVFSGKPLTSAGGPAMQGPDQRYMLLWGRWIDVKRAEAQAGRGREGGVVPRNWELVRRDAKGEETITERGVLTYDLLPDGGYVWSNGSRIEAVTPDAAADSPNGHQRQTLARGKLIERVIVSGASDAGRP